MNNIRKKIIYTKSQDKTTNNTVNLQCKKVKNHWQGTQKNQPIANGVEVLLDICTIKTIYTCT